MLFFDRIVRSDAFVSFVAMIGAGYFWFVDRTNRRVNSPENFEAVFEQHPSAIIVLWHGEHFMMPFLVKDRQRVNILMTLHRDGEILSRGCRLLGMNSVRGSGGEGREFVRKRAVRAFAEMLRVLRGGESIMMTADVPKVSRVAGLGAVTLAKHSQCPIIPVAMATSRRYRLANWDCTCFNLPFGRLAAVHGDPIFVPRDADDEALEQARRAVAASLHDITARAYALVGSKLDPAATRRPDGPVSADIAGTG